jgi:hypothetical protein
MLDVYKNSHVTIAAVRGSNSHSGFLQSRKDITYSPIPYRSTKNSRVTGKYFLIPATNADEYQINTYSSDIGRSNWSQRAWTVQEELLSRRVIFFGRRIHYRCHTVYALEWTRMVRDWSMIDISIYNSLSDDPSDFGAYGFWCRAVSLYSCRVSTIPEDILPAISGIAEKVGSVCGGHYLAGLWSGDLLPQLLWWDCEREEYPSANDAYLAPSWSWASRWSRYVEYHRPLGTYHIDCDVVDVDTTPSSNNMGRVLSGYLILSGRLRKFTKHELSERRFGDLVFPDAERLAERFEVDGTVCAILLIRHSKLQGWQDQCTTYLQGLILYSAQRSHAAPKHYTRIGSFLMIEGEVRYGHFFDDCPVEQVYII